MRHIHPSRLALFTASTAIMLYACQSGGDDYQKGAQEELAKEFSCPIERVVATPRKDLNAFDLMVGVREKPPAEIAADPARLAVWRKHQQETEDGYNQEHVFVVKGCDHEFYYVCSQATSGSTGAYVIACSKATHPPTPVK